MQFFRVNAQLAVINEAPHEAGGRENQQATSLLTNLLVALGLGQEELAGLTADRFNWPIAEGLGAMEGSPMPPSWRSLGSSLSGMSSRGFRICCC